MASALPLVLGILCKYGKRHKPGLIKRSHRNCQAPRPTKFSDPLPLFWSLRTEGRVHRVVHDGKDDVPNPETGVPGVDLAAEERNGRWQMLDEKRKNKTRDGFGIPGLLAEPTGTDGFRVLCHQFSPSSLPRLGNCIKRFSPCWLRRNQLREALLLQ